MSLTDDQREELFDALDVQHDNAAHIHASECCWPFRGALDALTPVVVKMLADAWRAGHRAALDGVFPLRPEDCPWEVRS